MKSLIDLVGQTPLLPLRSLDAGSGVAVLLKLESQNPGGSVKDRAALGMVKGAVDRGLLLPGMKLIEPTSGNTGISLAMFARLNGFEIELVMPADASRERVQMMRALGAKVTLTDAEKSIEGSIDYVRQKAEKGGFLFLDQFSNPDNPLSHYRTTGPEIWDQTGGRVTHFVSAMGTTGTIMGVSRFLKEHNIGIEIVGVQPAEDASIPGIRRWPVNYLPAIFRAEQVDRIIDVTTEEASKACRRLARDQGILAGMSSGAALFAALKLSREIDSGTIVCIVCDRGERYLSTSLFSGEVSY